MPKIRKVVTTVWYNKENMRALRRVFKDSEFVYVDFYDTQRLAEEAKDADVAIIMGDVPDCLLGENTLKWIACDHAGLNGSARPEVFARGIPVTGAAGRSALVLAEHCLYFMLQHCYHTKALLRAQEAEQWGIEGAQGWRGLYGRRAGIIGFGSNGRQLARYLKTLGMEVWAYNRSPVEDSNVDKAFAAKNGDTAEPILSKCDFVILTIALTDETRHLINRDTLALMKPDACLVNMSRGGIVDTEALTEALLEGKLGGAGLDVIEPEPLPAGHPLWHMDNVYLTPHTTPQVPDRARATIEIIAENKRRFENGEKLKNLMTERDAVTTGAAKSGWARMMNSGLTKEQIAKMDLEKFLGKRGWTDPGEWM